MKYLLIEDDDDKRQSIVDYLILKDAQCILDNADNLADARRLLLTKNYDLVIFDIYLPLTKGKEEVDISSEIVSEFAQSRNYLSEAITITKYDDRIQANSRLFNDNGVTVINYCKESDAWKQSLDLKISRLRNKTRCDFLIFCALTKERAAYHSTSATLGALKTIGGLNCQEITIDGFNGLCITPSHMGLVNMAIAATKGIETFQPKIVAMSGICAGVPGEANLLDLLVGEICWEYQTGKFKGSEFKQEPYQAQISTSIKTELAQLSEDTAFIESLKEGLYDTELKTSKAMVVPISSGSAVIANEAKMAEIGLQHRKMAGVEMEMYSLYEAARQSQCSPAFFGVKAVVDMGNSEKGDTLHETASIISARFVVSYLQKKVPGLSAG